MADSNDKSAGEVNPSASDDNAAGVTVTQADRDRAADWLHDEVGSISWEQAGRIRRGEEPHGLCDVLAAHRLASQPADGWRGIEFLRNEEADSVTILCDNPDGPPNNAVECCGFWTGFVDRRFEGVNVLEAINAAAEAKRQAQAKGYPLIEQASYRDDDPLSDADQARINAAWEKHKAAGPSEGGVAEVDCERCQGNGEIVTNWQRYKHPREGDKGDEAVTGCPDCGATGRTQPTPASPDRGDEVERLRERIVDRVSVFASMKPEEDESWESWYAASFDLLNAEITALTVGEVK